MASRALQFADKALMTASRTSPASESAPPRSFNGRAAKPGKGRTFGCGSCPFEGKGLIRRGRLQLLLRSKGPAATPAGFATASYRPIA